MSHTLSRLTVSLLAALATTAILPAQSRPPIEVRIVADEATRIADPKLPGGAALFSFHLEPAGPTVNAKAEVLQGGEPIAQVWSGTLVGGGGASPISWNGRDAQGDWCATGEYEIRVSAIGATPLVMPVEVVRLGVTEIEAQDSPAGNDEFPMVYFRKSGSYSYYATPAIHEYANLAPAGDVSDLDQNDGQPRPPVAVHTATAAPVLDGSGNYEKATYNYPVAYVVGTTPRFELTFGSQGTTADGQPMPAGYPVAGFDLRAVVSDGDATVFTGNVAAGGTATVDLAPLADDVQRTDLDLEVRWQYGPESAGNWTDVPGVLTIPVRVYTLLAEPIWTAGASGTRYAGPWVEVADYVSTWKDVLGMPASDVTTLTEVFVHGFVGQNGNLPEPIEGVIYDAYPLGGDGGATHYFSFTYWRMDLSRLLHNHANGVYVNCSDNMGATTTMLSMMGVPNMRPVRLGPMNLKAIWGIGAPDYTVDLWGSGNHGFSYHHIVTDDDGVTVSDTCMQLDEDGKPKHLPGVPGWNHHRKWSGVKSYNLLSSSNDTSTTLEDLPGIK